MSITPTRKAVILARGLGTRMRTAASSPLTPEQSKIADQGVKGLIPFARPFLDYQLSRLADAGYHEICLVIGPEHTAVRDYYSRLASRRIAVHFAIQEQPRGTADAVAAAETFAGPDPFLVLNSDNLYPSDALAALRDLPGPGIAAFDRDTLIAQSNISAQRIARFALISIENGLLKAILEKPDPALAADAKYISMNCWKMTPAIFDSCRAIAPSPRGEYELTDAVQHAINSRSMSFHAIPIQAPVFDLSTRDDIATMARHLQNVEVHL